MKRLFPIILGLILTLPVFSRELIKIGPYYGYFSPNEKIIRELYGGGSQYGARFGILLPLNFSFWVDFSQYRVGSKTTLMEENTTIAMNPVTLTGRYTLPLKFFIRPYAGIGFTLIDFKEESAIGKVRGNGGGFSIEGGIEIRFSANLFLETGIRYNSIRVKPTGFPVNVGGLLAGGSFLIAF